MIVEPDPDDAVFDEQFVGMEFETIDVCFAGSCRPFLLILEVDQLFKIRVLPLTVHESCRVLNGLDVVPGQEIRWHIDSLFVLDREVVLQHGHLQSIESLLVQVTQLFQWLVIRIENEMVSS